MIRPANTRSDAMRAAIARVTEATRRWENARYVAAHIQQSPEFAHLEPQVRAAVEETRRERSESIAALAALIGAPISTAPEGDSDEELVRHHPAVQAVALINRTFSTRIARARTN